MKDKRRDDVSSGAAPEIGVPHLGRREPVSIALALHLALRLLDLGDAARRHALLLEAAHAHRGARRRLNSSSRSSHV
jgi:hypothetical protein